MERWSTQQVASAAPDASSLAAARKLARPEPWSESGASDTLLWGRCQGSGRTPYQVSVDLTGPAYRCTCPSRKFPCKHALALLLLWADGASPLAADAAPAAHAQEWAGDRAARAARSAQRDARGEGGPADPEAAARRLQARVELMSAGTADLALWLGDLVRGGLAAARRQPMSWWDATAARLVDAQLPGLADQVRALGGRVHQGDDWAEPLLVALGRLWAATAAWQRRDELDADALGDLRAVLGWPVPAEEVRAADRVTDTWLVLGAVRSDGGRVTEQRTWLRGEKSGEVVVVLDFAAGGEPLPVARTVGALLQGDVSRFPGAGVRRALLTGDPVVVGSRAALPVGGDLREAQQHLAAVLARNPWTSRVPVLLRGVRLHAEPGAARPAVRVVDGDGRWLPVTDDVDPWPLLARTGGAATDLFGELEDGAARVLSASGLPGVAEVVAA